MIRYDMNADKSDRQTSQRQGVIEIPRGPRQTRRPFLHTVSTPMFGAMGTATPTMTYGRSPTAIMFSDSPRTVGVLEQAMGTPSRMIQIQHGGTPSTLILPHGAVGERFEKGNSPNSSPGLVPCNSPIDLNKGNPVKMGIHPVMRGLRHTPESHGWNAFSALIEELPGQPAHSSEAEQVLSKKQTDQSESQQQQAKNV